MRIGCSKRARHLVVLTALFLASGCATTRYPPVSEEGFPKLSGTGFDAAYLAENSDLGVFPRFRVEPCSVSFRDDWLRDQNYKRELQARITTEDMRRIERELADRCRTTFTNALAESSGASPAAESEPAREPEESGAPSADADEIIVIPPGVLVVRPAIIELDIAAPDVLTPGRSRSYTTSAGSMTLRLELVDASTGVVVGRIIDRRMAGDKGRPFLATRSGNVAETNVILRSWALLLVDLLERERASSP